jgi:predicted  nucleic acid-binding Zn-ribbon protein
MADLPSLPEAVRLRREVVAGSSAIQRLKRQLARSEDKADAAAAEAKLLREQQAADRKEMRRLDRATVSLRDRCTKAEQEAANSKDKARLLSAKVGVGRRDAAVVEHIRRLKSELKAARDARDGVISQRDELQKNLDNLAVQVDGLVMSLEVRADQLIMDDDDSDAESDGGAETLAPASASASASASAAAAAKGRQTAGSTRARQKREPHRMSRAPRGMAGDAAAEAEAAAEDAVSESLRLVQARGGSGRGGRAALGIVRKAALLFEVGRQREARAKVERALEEVTADLHRTREELSTAKAGLIEASATKEALTDRAASIAAEGDEARSECERLRVALSRAQQERDATLGFVEDQAGQLEEERSRVQKAEAAASEAVEAGRSDAAARSRLQAELEAIKRMAGKAEDALSGAQDEASRHRDGEDAAAKRAEELQEEVERLSDDVRRLSTAHRKADLAATEAQEHLAEAHSRLGEAQAEAAEAERQREAAHAGAESMGEALRKELRATLASLESAVEAQQEAERSHTESLARATAAEVARSGLEQQVQELTSSLASARQARSLLQSALGEQMSALRAGLVGERQARQNAEAELAAVAGFMRAEAAATAPGAARSSSSPRAASRPSSGRVLAEMQALRHQTSSGSAGAGAGAGAFSGAVRSHAVRQAMAGAGAMGQPYRDPGNPRTSTARASSSSSVPFGPYRGSGDTGFDSSSADAAWPTRPTTAASSHSHSHSHGTATTHTREDSRAAALRTMAQVRADAAAAGSAKPSPAEIASRLVALAMRAEEVAEAKRQQHGHRGAYAGQVPRPAAVAQPEFGRYPQATGWPGDVYQSGQIASAGGGGDRGAETGLGVSSAPASLAGQMHLSVVQQALAESAGRRRRRPTGGRAPRSVDAGSPVRESSSSGSGSSTDGRRTQSPSRGHPELSRIDEEDALNTSGLDDAAQRVIAALGSH